MRLTARVRPCVCRYKNPAALGFHMQQPHYKRYARFEERGGILSQDALVMEGLMGAIM